MDFQLLVHRLFKLMGRMRFFETRYGVKAYNRPPTFEPNIYITEDVVYLDPDELYLGYDGLNDEYSLCGTKAIDAPHYQLIDLILRNEDFSACEYIKREERGYLDGRFQVQITEKLLNERREMCFKCKQQVEDDAYPDVYVYAVDGRHYVLDGKHRIVMCHMLGKKVRCHVLDTKELRHDLYTESLYRWMKGKRASYSKNLEHMDRFMGVPARQPRVLIINRNRTNNLGDQAIAYSMVNLFERLGAEVELSELFEAQGVRTINTDRSAGTGLPPQPNQSLRSSMMKLLIRMGLRDRIWKIKNKNVLMPLHSRQYDFILIGGGEIVQSNGTFPVALDTWTARARAKQRRAKIGLFAVGATDNYSRRDYRHLKRALGRVDFAYVRDGVSAINLQEKFGMKPTAQIPDVVYTNVGRDVFRNEPSAKRSILYGITACHRIARYGLYAIAPEDYYRKSVDEIEHVRALNPDCDIRLFFMTQEDYEECVGFAGYYRERTGRPIEIEMTDSLEALIRAYKGVKAIYSPRMHACIIGNLMKGIEVNPIIISPKMGNYTNMYRDMVYCEKCGSDVVDAARTLLQMKR